MAAILCGGDDLLWQHRCQHCYLFSAKLLFPEPVFTYCPFDPKEQYFNAISFEIKAFPFKKMYLQILCAIC